MDDFRDTFNMHSPKRGKGCAGEVKRDRESAVGPEGKGQPLHFPSSPLSSPAAHSPRE